MNVEDIIDNQADSIWTQSINSDRGNECWNVVWRSPWEVTGMNEELVCMHIDEYLEFDI